MDYCWNHLRTADNAASPIPVPRNISRWRYTVHHERRPKTAMRVGRRCSLRCRSLLRCRLAARRRVFSVLALTTSNRSIRQPDDSPSKQLAVSHFADWSTRRLAGLVSWQTANLKKNRILIFTGIAIIYILSFFQIAAFPRVDQLTGLELVYRRTVL